ncbi:MarR family winged helix-turn-helix transcriptional regulator [Actinomadura xylanilytica]|uniref:MarR family winged helix-turn-helix transcriptional regulator n=1 Tax=Actinomadura xylanilytica TaxID=887459 RepID=UPI00255AA160|nr:MarR family transcriptional regulator [Actinomadura xylanilytica]MDL4772553.1 MarR family transcriptional regulator [Actinomadura xylanilytica]
MPAQDEQGLDVGDLAVVLGKFTRGSIRLPATEKHTFTTLSVLHTLVHKGPMRLTALKTTEQITQPAITQLVSRLERDGLVERRPDPADGRAVLVQVTPAGARIIQTRHQDRVRQFSELAEALTLEERHAIGAALPALARMAALMDVER